MHGYVPGTRGFGTTPQWFNHQKRGACESPDPKQKWVNDPVILDNDQPFFKGQKETPGGFRPRVSDSDNHKVGVISDQKAIGDTVDGCEVHLLLAPPWRNPTE